MICWSCEKSVESGSPFCPSCQALLPPPAGVSHFETLGAPAAFDLDRAELERRYKDLTRQVHPDRFARADPRARRAAMQRTVQLNEAWKILRDPVKRAEYLLSLSGLEVGSEEGTQRLGVDGRKERVPVPPELLMEVLELREALAEARSEADRARVNTLAAQVRSRREAALAGAGAALRARPAELMAAARELVAVRYFDRFLDEVDLHEEEAAEARSAAPGPEVGRDG